MHGLNANSSVIVCSTRAITVLLTLGSVQLLCERVFPELSHNLIVECFGFNIVRTVKEAEKWLQMLYASVYLEYRKTCNYSGNNHNHLAQSVELPFLEKEAKLISHLPYAGDIPPAYTHSSDSKLVGN